MQKLTLRLLGRFELLADGQSVINRSWSRRKAKALLKLVALQKERALHREQVLEALWPDLEPAAAANNLHKNLHYLRNALTAAGVTTSLLSMTGDIVSLSPTIQVDIEEFRQCAHLARASRTDPALYEQALSLYEGDLLPEDIYEDWTEPKREELRTLRLQLLTEVSQLYEDRGQVTLAADRLQQVLDMEPWHEDAHHALIRIYAQTGSRHRALRQYQICRETLQRELGVGPSAELEALYQHIVEGRFHAPARPAMPASAGWLTREWQTGPPFYGRERELELAESLLETALSGRGQALFIGGVAGIGKSRLVQQILAAAEEQGALTLTGRSYELEATGAYQPLRDILQEALSRLGDQTVGRFTRHCLHLRRLVGETGTATPVATGPALLQLELFNEIRRLFGGLASVRQGLVLCFDDLHAADEGSLALVHFLCRELLQQRMLVVATYRTEEATQDRPLRGLLASLRREHLAHEITLGPLPERTMTLLIEHLFGGQPVERELLHEVAQRAEGNPFFATELVHTLIDEGWTRLADGRWQRRGAGTAPVPAAVQDLLDRRLQRLAEPVQQTLQMAAILGRDFDYGVLRRALQFPENTILNALDDGIAAFIIEETADGYRFRHSLLREGIYSRLTRARREQLHRTAALALSDTAAGRVKTEPEIIGYHFARSDEAWQAVPYLHSAGRQAASLFANMHAISLYEQALSLAQAYPASVQPQDLASLMEDLGDVVRRTGDASQSIPYYEEVIALLTACGDPEGAVRARGKAALAHITRGDVQAASELLRATMQAITEQSPDLVVASTYYLLAQLRWHSAQHREALDAAEKALLAAEASGDVRRKAQAYEALALACHSLGDWQKGVEYELRRQALGISGFDTDEAFDAHL